MVAREARRRFRLPLDFGEGPRLMRPTKRPRRGLGWLRQADLEALIRKLEGQPREPIAVWQRAGLERGWWRP